MVEKTITKMSGMLVEFIYDDLRTISWSGNACTGTFSAKRTEISLAYGSLFLAEGHIPIQMKTTRKWDRVIFKPFQVPIVSLKLI